MKRGAQPEHVEAAVHRVHCVVGTTCLALALYVLGQAGWILWRRDMPEESLIDILLAVMSLVIMRLMALGKFRAARAVGSNALRAEAKETLACPHLSFIISGAPPGEGA